MGVSIGYATPQLVTQEVRTLVKQEADELSRGRDCGLSRSISSIMRLVGDSKLFRGVALDDTFLAWRDVQFIVATLARWAASFGVTWRLSYDDIELGIVDATGADDRFNAFCSNIVSLGRHPTSDPRTREVIAKALLETYLRRDS